MSPDSQRHGIGRRFARVSMVTGLSTVLATVLQLISVPVCLLYWGKHSYGSWLALFAAFTLVRTLDGGFINYVGNKINMLYHEDQPALRLTMASAVWGIAVLGVIQVAIVVLLVVTDSLGSPGSPEMARDGAAGAREQTEPMVALLVLSATWVISGSYIGILHRFLIPAGFMYQAGWWSMAFQLLQFVALIGSAMGGLTLLQAATLSALAQAVIYLSSAVYIKCKFPAFFPWWRGADRPTGMRDLWRSVPLTLSGIIQQGGTSGLIMLVTAFFGAAAVPVYTTVRTLSNLWVSLTNILTGPLLPEIVRLHVKGEGEKLLALHRAHGLLVNSTINLSILMAHPFLAQVFKYWTRNQLPLNQPLLDLMLASVSVAAMGALAGSLLTGLNRTGFVVGAAAVRGGCGLLLAAILLPIYGITGIGVAVFTTELLVLLLTIQWLARREPARSLTGGALATSFFGWSSLPTLCAVIYLGSESFGFEWSNIVYWLALAGIIIGAVGAWRQLGEDVKLRARSVAPWIRR